MMNRPEFGKGWMLLTTQPWGKQYRVMEMVTGEPTPAMIQMEFYYRAFCNFNVEAWLKACEFYATGEHWPSVDTLRKTVADFMPVKQLAYRHGSHHDGLSKDEFGVELFETVRLASAYRAAIQLAAVYRKQEKFRQAEQQEKDAAQHSKDTLAMLAACGSTFTDADVRRIDALLLV